MYFQSCRFDFNYHADGGYALITGGAEGLGKACANLMAQRGIDLFLVDFNEKLLTQTVAELKRKYPKLSIKSKVMDLTALTNEKVYNEFEVGWIICPESK